MQAMGHAKKHRGEANASHCKHANTIAPCVSGLLARLMSRWTSAIYLLLDSLRRQWFTRIAEYFGI